MRIEIKYCMRCNILKNITFNFTQSINEFKKKKVKSLGFKINKK